MPHMSSACRDTRPGLRGGAAATFAGVLLAFVVGSCVNGPSEETQPSAADSPQVPTQPPSDQLPLPAIMRGLERDMAVVDAGLWMENAQAVAAAARRVAEHPSVTLEYRQAIQEELGDEFPAFVAFDHEVHDAARLVAERAEAGASMAELLESQHEVARRCVACHTDFRSRLQPAMDRLRSQEP
jgi:hypothetical protein